MSLWCGPSVSCPSYLFPHEGPRGVREPGVLSVKQNVLQSRGLGDPTRWTQEPVDDSFTLKYGTYTGKKTKVLGRLLTPVLSVHSGPLRFQCPCVSACYQKFPKSQSHPLTLYYCHLMIHDFVVVTHSVTPFVRYT